MCSGVHLRVSTGNDGQELPSCAGWKAFLPEVQYFVFHCRHSKLFALLRRKKLKQKRKQDKKKKQHPNRVHILEHFKLRDLLVFSFLDSETQPTHRFPRNGDCAGVAALGPALPCQLQPGLRLGKAAPGAWQLRTVGRPSRKGRAPGTEHLVSRTTLLNRDAGAHVFAIFICECPASRWAFKNNTEQPNASGREENKIINGE